MISRTKSTDALRCHSGVYCSRKSKTTHRVAATDTGARRRRWPFHKLGSHDVMGRCAPTMLAAWNHSAHCRITARGRSYLEPGIHPVSAQPQTTSMVPKTSLEPAKECRCSNGSFNRSEARCCRTSGKNELTTPVPALHTSLPYPAKNGRFFVDGWRDHLSIDQREYEGERRPSKQEHRQNDQSH
jgi:hypothetical protein